MHNERTHIAAIAPTLDEARLLAREYHIPIRNAVSANAPTAARGRSFAGYILQSGYMPPRTFWLDFTPTLLAHR